ncbi:uncharacterized protein LOC126676777 [Mercurialis annua]|uniref:uncharacterized protein LOC126676777 n=1 Tax=Mercurialis annua TaxID=3986 RepID=UPI002160AF5B|nr:uncharacterized protein LOC126676777 [Mercurialis annua]
MTTAMGPPPPRNPNSNSNTSSTAAESETQSEPQNSSTTTVETPVEPPPTTTDLPEEQLTDDNNAAPLKERTVNQTSSTVPYKIPEWSGPPCYNYNLEVLKDGSVIDQLNVFEKGAYMFGRVDLCDFVLEHPTISRFHAVLQFKRSGDAYLFDLNSTHGTFINKSQVEKRVYVELHVGDVIRFGQSSRLYLFQGPTALMPPEKDLKLRREAKVRQEMIDRELSLRRARAESSLADGISWGMGEDAIEEVEDESDEITWQTYKGKLTEKQEKTRDKIVKRTEKIAHMKKEIDAIRAKDIAQGGLTQGQQTQIARNEQRITQILEELENLEETLNDSILESLGARGGRTSTGMGKGAREDDVDYMSDDDDFYDRTKKPSKQKVGENQSVETADTLLDKRDAILKEMEDKRDELLTEKNKMASETASGGDALDAYMSGLSSQLVLDKTLHFEKELASLQSELDRIFFLLKIADPSGEAVKKRDLRVNQPKSSTVEAPASSAKKQPTPKSKKSSGVEKSVGPSMEKERTIDSMVAALESNNEPKADKSAVDAPELKHAVYTPEEPQWLGAVDRKEVKETKQEVLIIDDADQFVDYKDRQKVLLSVDGPQDKIDSGIENAAPGLIIRKPKETERPGVNEGDQIAASSVESKFDAEDVVALLLKHKRGYHPDNEEGGHERQEIDKGQRNNESKKQKRVIGPEKPSFINSNSEYESWVPPEGQTGDGRTSLNDRFGY